MKYSDLISGIRRFGSTEGDICLHGLGIEREHIRKNVIIAPWWEPDMFPEFSEAEIFPSSQIGGQKIWDIYVNGAEITYIKTGIGAPVCTEAVLSLGLTPSRWKQRRCSVRLN